MYAGGNFSTAGGNPVNKVARWDGTTWWSMGNGVDDGAVFKLIQYGSNITVGGSFTLIGGLPVNRVASWNSVNWSNLSFGMNGNIHAFYASGTSLYAGGEFTFAGINTAEKIALWNGSSWAPVGSGILGSNAVVKSIVNFNGAIIAAGKFSTAGGELTNNIARWGFPVGISLTSSEIPSEYEMKQNYPNPFNPETNISFDIPEEAFTTINVFNSLGQKISILVDELLRPGSYSVAFNCDKLSSGVYYYTINSGNFNRTRKMILIK